MAGQRAAYLAVTDPQLADAYQHARHTVSHPVAIEPIGWGSGPDRSALAVLLWGGSRRFPADAVVAVVRNGHVLGYSPDRRPLLSLTWGPRGLFVLQSAYGDNPGKGVATYAGEGLSTQLTPLQNLGAAQTVLFNPAGNMLAEGSQNGTWAFVKVRAPACRLALNCVNIKNKIVTAPGELLGWLR